MSRYIVVLGFVCSTAVACKGGDSNAAKPAAEAPKAAPAAVKPVAPAPSAAPAAAASDRVDDPTFELSISPAGSYAVGQLGSFAVSLKPRGEYHINQDYPITVSLRAPAGLRLPKVEYKKPDAAVFGEELARFDVPLTPEQAGEQRVEAQVRFAVCTPETCVPDERSLALMLAVK
jgi:hypothetical protein